MTETVSIGSHAKPADTSSRRRSPKHARENHRLSKNKPSCSVHSLQNKPLAKMMPMPVSYERKQEAKADAGWSLVTILVAIALIRIIPAAMQSE
jgi:hypothetical protein